MILVYSDTISSRFIYVLNVLFKHILGLDYKLTTNSKKFNIFKGCKLNYSEKEFVNSVQIIPSALLFEKGIKAQNIKVDWVNEMPFFFKTTKNQYDILASSFWMLTRYEEYLPFTPDVHGRFKAEDSLAFQHHFLKIPVVNFWVLDLQTKFENAYPNFTFPKKKTSYLNTLDIDVAYESRGKGFVKFWGGFLVDILKKNKDKTALRLAYLKTKKDAFDTYDFIQKHSKNIQTIYFFLIGDRSTYDTNIKHTKKCLQQLVKKLSSQHEIGIHPSYASNYKPQKVGQEIKRLEKIINKKTTISRQHFLKMSLPNTYEGLIEHGITKDYTMGFAAQIGFRAGVCNAYPFYNLQKETQRPLYIVPFQVMDGTLNQYLKLSPHQAIKEIKTLIDEVKKVNGVFVSLWHNSSLSEKMGWQGWQKVYQEILLLMK